MLPVIEKIQYFSMAICLKRLNIKYQELTSTENPKACSRMMILRGHFEECTRDHCTILDIWEKKVVDKLII